MLPQNDLIESQLSELEKNGADQKLPIKEQIKLESVARKATTIAKIMADVELANKVSILNVDVADIASHSGVGKRALKKLTITSGEWGGASLAIQFDAASMLSGYWRITSTVDEVERTDARIQEFMAQITRPWWKLNTWGEGAVLMFPPAVIVITAFVMSAALALLKYPGLDARAALSAAYAAFAPYGAFINAVWWTWIVGSWFVGGRVWERWQKIFPRVDFRLGSNAERSLALARFRMAIISGIFAMFISPYAVPLIAGLFRQH